MNRGFIGDLERFGHSCYNTVDATWPWPSSGTDFVVPIYQRYQSNPFEFLTTLADIAEGTGGWVAYGAERLMIEAAGGNLARVEGRGDMTSSTRPCTL